jgi:hypothetical protein
MARLQLLLRVVNAASAVLVTRAVLSHPDAGVISLLLKAISGAVALGLAELGLGNYLQVAIARGRLSPRASRRARRFLGIFPLAAAAALTGALALLGGAEGWALACAAAILAAGGLGVGTSVLNQLAFSRETFRAGVRLQLAAGAAGVVAVLGGEALGLPHLAGATAAYALGAAAGLANTVALVRFLGSAAAGPGAAPAPPGQGFAWFSAEVLLDAVYVAGVTFVVSTEPVPERLRVYALVSRVVNTLCALLVVVYLSAWRLQADPARLARRLRQALALALAGTAAIAAVLGAGHDLWVPLLVGGQPHAWGPGSALLLYALLASRTFLNLNAIRARIAGAQPLATQLSAFNVAAGVLAVALLHPGVYSTLVAHAAALLAATALAYRAVGARLLHEDRPLQSAP